MGSSSSKLKKKLRKGDEESVLQLLDNSKALQKSFDPNSSYGDRYNNDTPLHLAARHAMKRTLWYANNSHVVLFSKSHHFSLTIIVWNCMNASLSDTMCK